MNPHVQTVHNMYGKVCNAELLQLKVDPYFKREKICSAVFAKIIWPLNLMPEENPPERIFEIYIKKNPLERILL